MRIAVDDLRLDSLEVIHAGSETYRLADKVRAVPLARIGTEIEPLVSSRQGGSHTAPGSGP
jgi:hypothetical protein